MKFERGEVGVLSAEGINGGKTREAVSVSGRNNPPNLEAYSIVSPYSSRLSRCDRQATTTVDGEYHRKVPLSTSSRGTNRRLEGTLFSHQYIPSPQIRKKRKSQTERRMKSRAIDGNDLGSYRACTRMHVWYRAVGYSRRRQWLRRTWL